MSDDKLNIYFDQQREQVVQETMGHLTRASEISPDSMAQAQRVSEETGLPAMELAQDPEGMAAHEDRRHKEDLLRTSPSLSKWLVNPENAALSQDELDALAAYDQMTLTTEANPEGTAFGRAVERGTLRVMSAPPALRATAYATALTDSTMTEQQLAVEVLMQATGLEQLPREVTDQQDAIALLGEMGFPASTTVNFMQVLALRQENAAVARENPERFLEGGADALERLAELNQRAAAIPMSPQAERLKTELAKDTTLSGTGLTMLKDPVGSAAFLGEVASESAPVMVASLITGIATRSPAVGAAMLGTGAVTQEVGASTFEFLQEEGVRLETREDAMALLANAELLQRATERGLTRGLVIAAFEVMGQGVAARALLKSPLATAAVQTGIQGATGAGGEAAAQYAAGQELNAQEILIEGLAEGVGVVVEGPAALIGQRRADTAAAAGVASASTITEINETVTNTQMRDRSPKSFRRFLQNGGFDKRNLYIDGTVLSEAVAADANLLAQLGVTAQEVQRAAEAGHSVPVNLATYMENIPGRNVSAETLFVKNGSLKPTTASKAQSDEYFTTERAERTQEAAQQEQRAVEAGTVREETAKRVTEQLVAAGQAPAAARASGELHGSFFQTLAERYGRAVDISLGVIGPNAETRTASGRTFNQSNPDESQSFAPDTITLESTGEPVRLYHGTTAQFDQFQDRPTFFTSRRGLAVEHAIRSGTQGARIVEATVALRNPLQIGPVNDDTDAYWLRNSLEIEARMKAGEHDGIMIWNDDGELLVIAQTNEQITQTPQRAGGRTFQQSAPTDSEAFREWAGTDKPVIEPSEINDTDFSGEGPFVMRAYHGTTHEFEEFDASIKGNKEGQFGAVNYFTSDIGDADANYAGEGPDLTNRIEQRYERLIDDIERDWDMLVDEDTDETAMEEAFDELAQSLDSDDFDASSVTLGDFLDDGEFDASAFARHVATAELSGGDAKTMEVYIRTEKPFVVSGESNPFGGDRGMFAEFIDFEALQTEAIEQIADEEGVTVDEVREDEDGTYEDMVDERRWEIMSDQENPLIEAVQAVSNRYEVYDGDQADMLDQLYEISTEGASHQQLEAILRGGLNLAEDPDTGELAGSHMLAEIITELGYDSIILKNANQRFSNMAMGGNTAHIHVLDQFNTNIKSVDNEGTFDRTDARIMKQDARGQITIPTEGVLEGTSVIELFKTADLSTFLHESGHFFLEAFQAVALKDDAPQAMKDDLATINEWMGRAEGDTSAFNTEQQEMWAEAFEAYLMEGKAPTPSLKAAFSKFASWLANIYKRVTDIGTQPSPEIKDVMDRLLATEEEIAAAREETDSQALFKDIPPGMSEAEWKPYQKLVAREEAETQGRALERAMAKVRRRRTKEYDTRLKQIETEVRATLQQQRGYRLVNALGNGADGLGPTARLDKKQLVDTFGEQVLQDLTKDRHGTSRNLYVTGGTDIDIAAETFGFDNIGQLITELRSTPKLDDQVAAMAEAQIENELGDPLDETSIREEAEAALKNGLATERVAREAAQLTRAASGDRGPSRWQQQNAAAKAEAQERVDQLTVREALGYRQYLRASQKAAREAQRQLATVVRKADGTPQPGSREALDAAAQAKRTQLLNDHMYRIARERARKFESARKRFNRITQRTSIQKNIGPEFMDGINTLLEQYSFKTVTLREVGRRADIRQLYQQLVEDNRGAELAIPLDVLARVEQVHYTELTVAELEGVIDAVDNLAHMGRATTKQLQADAQFDLLTAMDDIENRAEQNLKSRPQARERMERPGAADFYRQFQLHVLNADSILRDIDGDETTLGPAYNSIKRGIDHGVAVADARRQQAAKDIAALYTENLGTYRDIKKLREDKRVYPGLGDQPLTRLGLISIALNAGNEQNFERLTNENGKGTFRKEGVQQVLIDELTENEWRFVQEVWDYIDGFWPEIRDQERRYTGVTPKKVTAKLMVDGAPDFVKGGYFPIRYDPGISSNADDMERAKLATEGTVGVFGKAQTANGHAKERVASTGRPLDLDLSIIDNHVYNVIHDLELRGPVRDAARIVYSERFADMMTDKGRGEDTRALKAWLEDVAVGDKVGAYGMSRWFRWMRGGFTLSAIGFKVSTIMIQPLGLTQSLVQVGYGAMVRGYSQYVKQGPARAHYFVTEKSAIMQERIRTFDKDISQITQEITAGSALQKGYGRFLNQFMIPYAYAGMQHMQYWVVDLPTWLSSYEQALRKGESEADAIVIADRDVRIAQGSGLMSDRGMIERGRLSVTDKPTEVARLFTVLGSYMFGKFNLAYRRVRGTDYRNPLAIAKLSMDLAMLYVVEAMLVYLLRNGWPDDEDDEPPLPLIAAREGFFTFLGTMPVFRDVASTLQGFGGGAAYAEYTGAVGALADAGTDVASFEWDRKTAEGLLGFGGTAFFLPSGQINSMLDAVFTRDFEIEDDALVNFLESITGLPVGGEDES